MDGLMLHRRFSGKLLGLAAVLGLLVVFIPQPTIAAGLIAIEKRGNLIVGVKDDLRPLGFRDTDGQLVGLEIDLAHYLAKALLGNSEAVTLQPLDNRERLDAVMDDRVDLVIAGVTATSSRSRLINFSTPYYLDGTALVTSNQTIQTLKDLQQATIAVLNGSSAIATVRSLLPNVRLVGVASYQAGKDLLEAGQAQAFAGDASVLTGWTQEYPRYHLLPTLLSAEALAVAIPKGLQYDELRRQVDAAIAQWQSEGLLKQRVLYWGLPEAGVPRGNFRSGN